MTRWRIKEGAHKLHSIEHRSGVVPKKALNLLTLVSAETVVARFCMIPAASDSKTDASMSFMVVTFSQF